MALESEGTTRRQRWMSVMAKADDKALLSAWSAHGPSVEFVHLRKPEAGLVMTQGKISGTGAPFNLGELSVTRCSVRLDDDRVGHAYVSGRSKEKAEAAAIIDALMQGAEHDELETAIIAPLEAAMATRRAEEGRKAAATKVEFFTMARSAAVK
ncbi:MAG: phosphonate C-P lyase system protein PhnG [Pseudomonadota bacterium]